jgi:nitroimidazol reductase NimA-like FMN-containing flavoprotein (pyridoxamine 5'-phosphate oxidase superfamily)
VAFAVDGVPTEIPTLHARHGDSLLLHGAKTSRLLLHAAAGHVLSVAITLVDGIVLARSVFLHSMTYRSVVIHGAGTLGESDDDKLAALEAFSEHIARGRWADARRPTKKELKATTVISMPIDVAGAKIRTGPPIDDDEDYALPIWAGVMPLDLVPGKPVPDPRLSSTIELPGYLKRYRR